MLLKMSVIMGLLVLPSWSTESGRAELMVAFLLKRLNSSKLGVWLKLRPRKLNELNPCSF